MLNVNDFLVVVQEIYKNLPELYLNTISYYVVSKEINNYVMNAKQDYY